MNEQPRFYRLTRPLGARLSQPRRLALLVAGAALLGLLALAVVHRRQRIVHLGYELSRLVKERDALAEELRGLQVERAVLAAPERVRRLALELGMQAPQATDVVAVPLRPMIQEQP